MWYAALMLVRRNDVGNALLFHRTIKRRRKELRVVAGNEATGVVYSTLLCIGMSRRQRGSGLSQAKWEAKLLCRVPQSEKLFLVLARPMDGLQAQDEEFAVLSSAPGRIAGPLLGCNWGSL